MSAPERIWANPDHWINHPPRRDAFRPEEYAEYTRADLARPQVKPLVWRYIKGIRCWRASSIVGEYEVDSRGDWTRTSGDVIGRAYIGGKAAAQADYNTRILSALVPAQGVE